MERSEVISKAIREWSGEPTLQRITSKADHINSELLQAGHQRPASAEEVKACVAPRVSAESRLGFARCLAANYDGMPEPIRMACSRSAWICDGLRSMALSQLSASEAAAFDGDDWAELTDGEYMKLV
jgi:hypothetical protein